MTNLIELTNNENATHTHDCDDCTFCGSFRDLDKRAVKDVYRGCDGSLIIRTGSEGPDYCVYSGFAIDLIAAENAEVAFALQLAERGPR